jgi:hypothetical protein
MSVYVLPNKPVTNNLAGLAGGAQAGATQLTTGYNEINTILTTGDSFLMPPAVQGMQCLINCQNTAAGASAKIYAAATNPYNGNLPDQLIAHGVVALTPNATALTLANGHVSEFICTTQGQWKQNYDNA